MSISAVGGNAAIAYARQAPPLLAPQATADAVQITMFKKAIDTQAQQALMLIEGVTQVGQTMSGHLGRHVNVFG